MYYAHMQLYLANEANGRRWGNVANTPNTARWRIGNPRPMR